MITFSSLGPTIETARLILRPPIAADFDAFAAMHADEEVMKFLGGTQSKALCWRTFNGFAGAWHLYGFSMFCLIDKQSGEWLGRVGTIHPYGWPEREVGWGIIKSAMGKGLALEAAVATMDYAFDVLGWEKAIHCIDPLNTPSQALAIKLGSYNQGKTQLPDPLAHINVEAWGQTREEWLVNRQKFV